MYKNIDDDEANELLVESYQLAESHFIPRWRLFQLNRVGRLIWAEKRKMKIHRREFDFETKLTDIVHDCRGDHDQEAINVEAWLTYRAADNISKTRLNELVKKVARKTRFHSADKLLRLCTTPPKYIHH